MFLPIFGMVEFLPFLGGTFKALGKWIRKDGGRRQIAYKPGRDHNNLILHLAGKKRKTIQWERLEISLRKSEIASEDFMQRWAQ